MSREHISCEELIEQLFVYLDRELEGGSCAAIEHHLERCRECFSRVEFERQLRGRIGDAGIEKAPERLRRRVKALLDEY